MSDTVQLYWLFPGGVSDRPLSRIVRAGLSEEWQPRDVSEATDSPDRVRYTVARNEPTGIGDLDTTLAEIEASTYASLWLKRGKLRFHLQKNPRPDLFEEVDHLAVETPDTEFKQRNQPKPQREAATENVESLLSITRLVIWELGPAYGFGTFGTVSEDAAPSATQLEDGLVSRIFWMNIFGPSIVTRFKTNVIRETPAWHVEKLDDHYLIVTTDNPVQPSDEWTGANREVADWLSIEE